MPEQSIQQMHEAHEVLNKFQFDTVEIEKGYANRTLRIDLNDNEFTIQSVSQQMKDLWVGGKGFDMWLMFQEISKGTRWDSPENPICFSSGPLGGTTSFPGSGKTLVTSISPLTNLVIDSNVGGYFGPYLKFTGFDALTIVGKASEEIIIFIDALSQEISIEKAPLESIDSHVVAEELTEMYADDELDMKNIAVVSAGSGADHVRMGILNFSFWDWRRRVIRLKQAGRGGIGRVFRDKRIKAIVLKNRGITPAWRIEESKVTKLVAPKTISRQTCENEIDEIRTIIEKNNCKSEYIIEMLLDIQKKFRHISKTAIEQLSKYTSVSYAKLYNIVTFYKCFSLEPRGETIIEVCTGTACQAKGAQTIIEAFERTLGIKAGETTEDKKYTLEGASCLGACEIAPVIKMGEDLIGKVKAHKVEKILESGGVAPKEEKEVVVKCAGIEKPVIMGNFSNDYSQFKQLLKNQNPDKVINEIKKSGLQGRGGGGFSTGEKWDACRKATVEQETTACLVCNSAIFEPSLHRVIEGMLIGAFTVGATEGHVCFRHEHLPALERFEKAVDEAKKAGVLGKNILGTDFSFKLFTHRGAGGFVIGESSALLQTISGSVGEPQAKFVHSAESGLQGRPTLVNNIETWATIPLIIEQGSGNYTQTKVLSLSGDVKYTGLVEAVMGTSIQQIIDECSGGIAGKNRTLKAAQIGGPSGGFLPADMFDTKIDYGALKEVGGIIGSGAVAIKDNHKCMVDSARVQVQFLLDESCGKCTSCREGLYAIDNILTRICDGKGTDVDMTMLKDIADTLAVTSFCQFGKTAANPVLSSLKYFSKEYEAHIKDKKCEAGVCKELISFTINDKCTGCMVCAKNCPVDAITGEKKALHVLDHEKCIKCGICYDSCKFDSVEVI